jgi:uncharacterized protein
MTLLSPSGFDPNDIEPPLLRERNWPLEALALDVSGRCNLACRYCAEAATQPSGRKGMDSAIVDAALDRLSASESAKVKSIRLGSGEPLLAKRLLQQLAHKLEANRRQGVSVPEVFLTTNGTLLDPQVREWLVESGWHVKVSLDGPPAVQNYWRVTTKGRATYDQVAEAVSILACRIPDRFSVTAVLCRDSDPAAVFDAITELGVRRIELVPAGHTDPAIVPSSSDVERYRRFANEYVERRISSRASNQPELVKVINAARRVMGYDVKRVTCGAGRNFFGVGPDGDLYPCFRFIGVDSYHLGNIATGFDEEAVGHFRRLGGRPYDQRESCSGCWVAPLCGGPCFAEAELLEPYGDPLAIHCDYVRADAEAAIHLVEGLRQKNPDSLLSLLAGLVEY